MLSAWEGKQLKSTKLGAATNEALTVQGCPTVQLMRHVREHFSTELMMSDTQLLSKATAKAIQNRSIALAILTSNHSVETGLHHYAGMFERDGVGGLRMEQVRQKLAFSALFNEVVLGYVVPDQFDVCKSATSRTESKQFNLLSPIGKMKDLTDTVSTQGTPATVHRSSSLLKLTGYDDSVGSSDSSSTGSSFYSQFDSENNVNSAPTSESVSEMVPQVDERLPTPAVSANFELLAQQLQVETIRPLQRQAAALLLGAQPFDTKFIVAPTSMGKDMLPFIIARVTNTVQILFVPLLTLIDGVARDAIKYKCKIVRFADIARKKITIETAAASAHVVVCSYEHSSQVISLAQELKLRDKLGKCFHLNNFRL